MCGKMQNQPAEMALTGQAASQDPQSKQAAASITYCVSPWLIALTGHSLSQEPQEMQESEITYAIRTPPILTSDILSFRESRRKNEGKKRKKLSKIHRDISRQFAQSLKSINSSSSVSSKDRGDEGDASDKEGST